MLAKQPGCTCAPPSRTSTSISCYARNSLNNETAPHILAFGNIVSAGICWEEHAAGVVPDRFRQRGCVSNSPVAGDNLQHLHHVAWLVATLDWFGWVVLLAVFSLQRRLHIYFSWRTCMPARRVCSSMRMVCQVVNQSMAFGSGSRSDQDAGKDAKISGQV